MGNIVFPNEAGNYWNTKEKGMKFICGNTVLHFDIGDISIAASREDLEYNASTIQAIKKKAFSAWNDFIKTLNNGLNLCDDGVKARAYLNRVSMAGNGSSWGDVTTNLKWPYDLKPITAMVDLNTNLGMTVESFISTDGVKVSRGANLKTLLVTDSLIADDLMYLCDDNTGAVTKISDLARKNKGKVLYLFRVKEIKGKEGEVVVGDSWFSTQHFPKSYLKNISEHTVDKLKKESTNTVRRPRSQMETFEITGSYTRNWGVQSNNWTSKIVNKSDIKYYLELNKFKPVIGNIDRSCETIVNLEKHVNKYGIVLPKYHCVKSADVAKLDDEAVGIIEYIKDRLDENSDYKEQQLWSKFNYCVMNLVWHSIPILGYAEIGKFDPSHYDHEKSFAKLATLVVKAKSAPSKMEAYNEIKSILGNYDTDEDKSYVLTIKNLVEEVINDYPLLQYIEHIVSSSSTVKNLHSHVSEYIKLIENK